MKYSIIIPTYNHCDDLLKPCITSILCYSNIYDIELIISANGCTDNTKEYLKELQHSFNLLQLQNNLKIVWNDNALGYAKACNEGIKIATTDLIVLLNNDTMLLWQKRNHWLEILESGFIENKKCGISCISKIYSEITLQHFAVFFCVMIHKKVFDKLGLLSLDYGIGAGEDTEFCFEAVKQGFEIVECLPKTWSDQASKYVGQFPLYHKGEGTVNDKSLVPDFDKTLRKNGLILAKKYNPSWYKWALSNHAERGIFFKDDTPFRYIELTYQWAASKLYGSKILEIGCSSGYGAQYFPNYVSYTGIDHDESVIQAAIDQNWKENVTFITKNIETEDIEFYDTIIILDTLFQIHNGLSLIEKLQSRCNRLLISVPYAESTENSNLHTKIYNLDKKHFPNFKFEFIVNKENLIYNIDTINYHSAIMLCEWNRNQ